MSQTEYVHERMSRLRSSATADSTSITKAITSDKWSSHFKDLGTWKGWIAFLETVFGLPFSEGSQEIVENCTERRDLSGKSFREAYAMVGRGGGKSFISALIASYLAIYADWSQYLAKGERAWVFCVATDRRQAEVVLGYIKGFLEPFSNMVLRSRAMDIDLKNGITIGISTCTIRAGRGFALACVIMDELAFWRDEYSANPADDVIWSLQPRLLDNGLLIGVSSSYGPFGCLYETHKEHFGKEGSDVLFWKASTLTMNPTYNKEKIEKLIRRNPAKGRAEFMAEFREDVETYLSESDLEAVTMTGRRMLLPIPGVRYKAFTDPSGGKKDSFALAIAHVEGDKVVHDRLEERKPPYDPDIVVREYCKILKNYNCHQVVGDEFGGVWCASKFREYGIRYIPTSGLLKTKNDIYATFQPMVLSGMVELLDNKRLDLQLRSLETRTQSGGRDSVDHPKGQHDDVANVVAGVSTTMYKGLNLRLNADYTASRLPTVAGKTYGNLKSESKKQEHRVLEKLRKEGVL